MKRGEIWLADLGYTGKVRPVLVLSQPLKEKDGALVIYVIRTTSVRDTEYEIEHTARGMKLGSFDAQGLGSPDKSRFIRYLGNADQATLTRVENPVRLWLGL